jgi:tetrahydromethanopterin S-methyltransferase subunit F
MMFPTALQSIAPARFRARVVAVQAVVNLVFAASAAPLVGAVSDRLKGLDYGLMWAIVGVAIPGLLIGAALMFRCERGYPAAVAAAEAEDNRPL